MAPSIRWKATRLPPESTTATFIFQFRFFASATAASISDWARSSDIGGPYGVSKGILSGTKSRGFVCVGCIAGLAPTALPVFSFDIRPPSHVSTGIYEMTSPKVGTRPPSILRIAQCEIEAKGLLLLAAEAALPRHRFPECGRRSRPRAL